MGVPTERRLSAGSGAASDPDRVPSEVLEGPSITESDTSARVALQMPGQRDVRLTSTASSIVRRRLTNDEPPADAGGSGLSFPWSEGGRAEERSEVSVSSLDSF